MSEIDWLFSNVDPFDFPEGEYYGRSTVTKTCRYCNTANLKWVTTKFGWRLADIDGNIHSCKQFVKSGDDC